MTTLKKKKKKRQKERKKEKRKGTCRAKMELSGWPKRVYGYRLVSFSTFNQPKRRIKMALVMLPLPAEAITVEEKTNTCTNRRYPTYH